MARDVVDELNRAMPANARVKLGQVVADIIQSLNGINEAPEALVNYIDDLAGMIDELATRFDTLSGAVNGIAAAANTLATRLDTTNGRANAIEGQVDALLDKLDADGDITATDWLSTIIPTPLADLATTIQADLNMDVVSVVTDTQADLNADEVDAAGDVAIEAVTPVKTLSERAAEIGG